jgi:hypothetical protein
MSPRAATGARCHRVDGRQAPPGSRDHVNIPAAVPPDVEAALAGIGRPEMTDEERTVFEALGAYRTSGYSVISSR